MESNKYVLIVPNSPTRVRNHRNRTDKHQHIPGTPEENPAHLPATRCTLCYMYLLLNPDLTPSRFPPSSKSSFGCIVFSSTGNSSFAEVSSSSYPVTFIVIIWDDLCF